MTFSNNKPYLLRALYEWILDNNGTPHIIVNADAPGVDVPREHVQNGEIVLNVSPNATQGLELENHMIFFSARFSGVVRHIQVPMHAVVAIVARENGQGMVFPPEEFQTPESDSTLTQTGEPENIISDLDDSDRADNTSDTHRNPKEKVSAEKSTKEDQQEAKKPGTSHLRIVK